MVKYLKKSRIHKLAQSMGYSVPALRGCSYKSGYGSEWFSFPAGADDEYYIFYICGSYMSVERVLDEVFSKHVIERKLYYGKDYNDILLMVS